MAEGQFWYTVFNRLPPEKSIWVLYGERQVLNILYKTPIGAGIVTSLEQLDISDPAGL
jgi:hypothetical protein